MEQLPTASTYGAAYFQTKEFSRLSLNEWVLYTPTADKYPSG